MKIRAGHVSNSSSSSFIIATDKPLDSVEAIKEQVFHNAGSNTEGWVSGEYWDDPFRIEDLCEGFKQGICEEYETECWNEEKGEYEEKNYSINTIEDILNCEELMIEIGWRQIYSNQKLNQDYYDNLPAWNNHEACEKYEIKWNQIALNLAKEYMEKQRPKFEGKHIVYAVFADEDGRLGCQLEHGSHWHNVANIRISHH